MRVGFCGTDSESSIELLQFLLASKEAVCGTASASSDSESDQLLVWAPMIYMEYNSSVIGRLLETVCPLGNGGSVQLETSVLRGLLSFPQRSFQRMEILFFPSPQEESDFTNAIR